MNTQMNEPCTLKPKQQGENVDGMGNYRLCHSSVRQTTAGTWVTAVKEALL